MDALGVQQRRVGDQDRRQAHLGDGQVTGGRGGHRAAPTRSSPVASRVCRSARSAGEGSTSGARTGPPDRPQPGSRLDQRDGVPGHPVADGDERDVELAQQRLHQGVVAVAQGGEEGRRDLGCEGVDGGGVGRYADRGVRTRLEFGGGGPVEEQEALGRGEGEALQPVEVAVAVLEPDDAGDAGDAPERLGAEGDLAALVGDERERGAGGDLLQLRDEPSCGAATR